MRTLHFTQITDSRFNSNIADLMNERIAKLEELFANIPGVVLKHYDKYKVIFDDCEQYRADFYIQKNTKKYSWNDIYGMINSVKSAYYEFVNFEKFI